SNFCPSPIFLISLEWGDSKALIGGALTRSIVTLCAMTRIHASKPSNANVYLRFHRCSGTA
ncbi:hypothetical protein WG66_012224, partial [Moniliophthora roreri]